MLHSMSKDKDASSADVSVSNEPVELTERGESGSSMARQPPKGGIIGLDGPLSSPSPLELGWLSFVPFLTAFSISHVRSIILRVGSGGANADDRSMLQWPAHVERDSRGPLNLLVHVVETPLACDDWSFACLEILTLRLLCPSSNRAFSPALNDDEKRKHERLLPRVASTSRFIVCPGSLRPVLSMSTLDDMPPALLPLLLLLMPPLPRGKKC